MREGKGGEGEREEGRDGKRKGEMRITLTVQHKMSIYVQLLHYVPTHMCTCVHI